MLLEAVRIRLVLGGGAVPPTPEVVELLSQCKSAASWNRYVSALGAWEKYALAQGTSMLPADPGHFANFLAGAAAGTTGYSQTKQRCVAIEALSTLAKVPSPVAAEGSLVKEGRQGVRRTKGATGKQGRVRATFPSEIPAAAAPHTPPPPANRQRGGCRVPASVRLRARAQATRHLAIMSSAGLRHDDLQEGQLGDVIVHPDMLDVSVFGSKTDQEREGQPAVVPASQLDNSGYQALLVGTRLGLQRLVALPDEVLNPLAASFRAMCTQREIGEGQAEFASWPADIRALAAPLYARGLPVHCLPIYGTWQFNRLSATSDLREAVSRGPFWAQGRSALRDAGVEVAGTGTHSLRRGAAVELFHGGADASVVSEVLRHANPKSARPYVLDAARMAKLSVTMAAIADTRAP